MCSINNYVRQKLDLDTDWGENSSLPRSIDLLFPYLVEMSDSV